MKKLGFILIMLLFFTTGCSKEIKYNLENNDNYQAKIKIEGKLNKKAYREKIYINKFSNNEILFDNQSNTYYLFSKKAYKDPYMKKVYNDKQFLSKFSEYTKFLNKTNNTSKKEETTTDGKEVEVIHFELSKKQFNQILDISGIKEEVLKSGKGEAYFLNDNLIKLVFSYKDFNIEINYTNFGSVSKLLLKEEAL